MADEIIQLMENRRLVKNNTDRLIQKHYRNVKEEYLKAKCEEIEELQHKPIL